MGEQKPTRGEDDRLIFEYPLAERVRGFLRLEASMRATRANMTAARQEALKSLVEIAALSERSELKRELLSELERQRVLLEQLANNSSVDGKRLERAVKSIGRARDSIAALPEQLGGNLKRDEFLSTLRSRSAMPGGTCAFDMPSLHLWLSRPAGERRQDLEHWMEDMAPVEKALSVLLKHVREAAPFEPAQAPGGIYEYRPAKKNPPLLLRIELNPEKQLYPQISGSPQRVTIQFQQWQGITRRSARMRGDIDFELAVCRL